MFRPSDHDAELSEEEFRLLRDFIHERFGLFFEDTQRGSLRARLAGRLQGLDLVVLRGLLPLPALRAPARRRSSRAW